MFTISMCALFAFFFFNNAGVSILQNPRGFPLGWNFKLMADGRCSNVLVKRGLGCSFFLLLLLLVLYAACRIGL